MSALLVLTPLLVTRTAASRAGPLGSCVRERVSDAPVEAAMLAWRPGARTAGHGINPARCGVCLSSTGSPQPVGKSGENVPSRFGAERPRRDHGYTSRVPGAIPLERGRREAH